MFIYDKAAQQKFVTNHISPFYFSIWGTQKICQMTKDLKGNWIPFTCFVLLIKFYVGCIETRSMWKRTKILYVHDMIHYLRLYGKSYNRNKLSIV